MIGVKKLFLKDFWRYMSLSNKDFVPWLQSKLDANHWSQNKLAKEAGITSGMMSKIMSGLRPGLTACQGIARAFSVDPNVVLRLAGHITTKPSDPDPRDSELVALFHQLSEEARDDELAKFRLMVERGKKRGRRGATKASPSGA